MKKWICIILTIWMLAAMVTGFADSNTTWDINNVGTDFPFEQYVTDETAKWNLGRNVDFSWYFNYNHHYGTKPWSEYTALAVAAQITGINVTGEIPTGDPTEKVNLMMANNDLPDLVTLGYGDPLGQALIEGGYVLCLEDLLKKYEPEFWESMPASLKQNNTEDALDGKMWAISGVTMPDWQFTNKYGLGGFGYSVRKDLWTEMGSPSIATPDDLYNVLKQFKDKYPTLSGKSSIGVSGYSNGAGMMMTMGYSFGIYDVYVDEATQVCTSKYLNPNYPDFIAYMNKLYREGLIDPEVFIKNTQKNVEDMSTCAFMMPYVFWAADPASAILNATNPESHFIAIDPMSATGEEFKAPSGLGRLGVVETYVSKSCADLEAAARLIAYGFSPAGTMQISRGNPGENWVSKDGVWAPSQEAIDAAKVDAAAYNMKYGLWDYYSLWYPPMPQKPTESEDRINYDRAKTDAYAFDSTLTTYNMTPGGSSDEGIAFNTIEAIANEAYVAAITAKTSEKSVEIIAKMIEDIRNTRDFDKLQEFMTQQYKKNVEKFSGPKF